MTDIEWIFFDIGSTLVDEGECYKARYREAVVGMDITVEDFEKKVLEFSKQNKKGDHEAAKYYGIHLPPWHKEKERLYTDAEFVLKKLVHRGYKIGIIANQSPGTRERLTDWGIIRYIDLVFASAEGGVAKPDIEIFNRALSKAKCLPKNAVMIGDRLDNDISPAKSIGMKTVWIKQGLGGLASVMSESEKADYEVFNLPELLALF